MVPTGGKSPTSGVRPHLVSTYLPNTRGYAFLDCRQAVMGQMHFDVPEQASEFFHASWWQQAYLCGIEGVPWQTRNVFKPSDANRAEGSGLYTLTRGVDTSAKLLLTCPIDGIGYRVLTTCSLRCQDEPHRLIVELARGSCYRVRLQADTWHRGGLTLSDEFDQLLEQGTQAFIESARIDALSDTVGEASDAQPESDLLTSTTETSSVKALEAIQLLERAATLLGDMFAAQSLAFRQTREPRLSTMLAAGVLPLGDEADLPEATGSTDDTAEIPDSSETGEPPIEKAFNAAAVRISWSEIETDSGQNDFSGAEAGLQRCASAGIRVIGGPLVDHRDGLLPQWLTLVGDDFEKQLSAMIDFTEATVNRFRGRVHLWNAASGLNAAGPFGLDDEQAMRFSIGILQTIRRCDPNTPVVISIEQPCGEYLANNAQGISPIHYADALLRSGLGLAGIGLNFRFGYEHGQTHPRSSLDFGHVIDRWATLNAPLLVQLSVAGAAGEDAEAHFQSKTSPLSPTVDSQPGDWAKLQAEFARPLVQTLLAKQIVHAIVWDGYSDSVPHLTPHGGVIDAAGKPRPLLNYFTRLREKVLM